MQISETLRQMLIKAVIESELKKSSHSKELLSQLAQEFQSTNSTLDRFTEKFLPIVDCDRFPLEISLESETIKIHILKKLPDGNEAYAINEFYKLYRDQMLDAIVQTGKEIQLFQISCESRSFAAHDARKLIEELREYDQEHYAVLRKFSSLFVPVVDQDRFPLELSLEDGIVNLTGSVQN